ncbi:glycosyltransferase [Neisseria leonii]|uniref:Glycosyltransferase n=1 Tax=Neisseria leonii TaxID=2995413 RepID=A0A9X4IDV0_9NEIS|nr:glycosyltransferase [Neisseria sp. 51.81]MDD9327508.1 glycosyltransferase [Neisseria sp. 51.81]
MDSITGQSYPHWQLVIINDGAEPAGINRLTEAYQAEYPGQLELIHLPQPVGPARAANTGLLHLDTELAAFHDDDDTWSPDFLLRATQTYREAGLRLPQIGGVVCHVNRVVEDVEGNIIRIRKTENHNQHIGTGLLSLRELCKGNFIPLIGFLFDLKTAKETGLFDPGMSVLSDWDFCLQMMMKKDIWLQGETLAAIHHRETVREESHRNLSSDIAQTALYTVYLENKWLRRDLQNGRSGAGTLMNLLK